MFLNVLRNVLDNYNAGYNYSLFTDEETEARRSKGSILRNPTRRLGSQAELAGNLSLSGSKIQPLSLT